MPVSPTLDRSLAIPAVVLVPQPSTRLAIAAAVDIVQHSGPRLAQSGSSRQETQSGSLEQEFKLGTPWFLYHSWFKTWHPIWFLQDSRI